MSEYAPDWDALAPYWHCFEGHGLNAAILSTLDPLIAPPVLYVGGGLGTYPARLRERLGASAVTVVDGSTAMAARAHERFGIPYFVADARALPFPGDSFTTVIVASGVVEPLPAEATVELLREAARVLRKGGSVVLSAFYLRDQVVELARGLGAWAGDRIDTRRLVDVWYSRWDALSDRERRFVEAFTDVAREMGDRAAAHRFLLSALPHYDLLVDAEAFPSLAERAGMQSRTVALLPDDGVAVFVLTRTTAAGAGGA